MKTQRFLLVLTAVNLGTLLFFLTQNRPAVAEGTPGVLRGRSLEIVDEQGKVRASLQILPPSRMPDGKLYPESVLLRLIALNGRPSVKLQATLEGGGLYLGGESDPTYALLKAEGGESSLKLINKDGREEIHTPALN